MPRSYDTLDKIPFENYDCNHCRLAVKVMMGARNTLVVGLGSLKDNERSA